MLCPNIVIKKKASNFQCFSSVSNMTSTQLVYAYPVFLCFEDANQNEVFITFQEPNFFNNPWSSLGLKISASIIWLIGLCGSGFICTFVFYETQGYAASFRTVINQLVTWCYFYVSLKNVSDCIPYQGDLIMTDQYVDLNER